MAPRLRRLGGRLHLLQGSPNTVLAVEESEAAVVDPGIGEGRGAALVEAVRGLAGEEGAGGVHVVLTHGHTDHLAAAPPLVEAFSARVHAPRLCVGLVESTELRRLAVYGGVVSEQLAAMPMVSLAVDVPYGGSSALPLGARPLPLPGHTPGSSAVVFEEERLVAAGDAVLGERVLARFGVPFAADLRGWAEGLRRLRELAEAGYTVVPGHGPVARGRRAVAMIDANLSAVERVREYVLSKLRETGGIGLDRLAYLATAELGAAEPTPRQLLLNRTALASVLAWLEEEGKAEPASGPEGPLWRPR